MSRFQFPYRICLADTDAAGVVYFARLLEICHRAYEAALAAAGLELGQFLGRDAKLALPIVRVEGRFFAPLYCGDEAIVGVAPTALDACRYGVDYQIFSPRQDAPAAIARTEHACIDLYQRQRQPLPEDLRAWVAAGDRDRGGF